MKMRPEEGPSTEWLPVNISDPTYPSSDIKVGLVNVKKTLGIETEYGIIHKGVTEPNPIIASSLLINAYLHAHSTADRGPSAPRPGWDFIHETPDKDLRGFDSPESIAPEIEAHMVNAVLTNGSRYYVDHAHPELSSPECADPLSVVKYDCAADQILISSMEAAKEILPPGQELVVYKNNSDGKGNSYGCHENYLVNRGTSFERIADHATTHFITRQVFTGAGKVGCEISGRSRSEIPFQITQRADFFEEPIGLETTLKRPIINTRDEPHADPAKYRRLHVIVGDANLCQVATFLKVGTTAIVLSMIESDALNKIIKFKDPVRSLQEVSFDLQLNTPLELIDGSTSTALEIQWWLYGQAKEYVDKFGTENIGGDSAELVLHWWEKVLTSLDSPNSLETLVGVLDWVTKKHILDGFQERKKINSMDPQLAAIDLQYHDLRPHKSLFKKVHQETLVSETDTHVAVKNPPEDTRAYFRGKCLTKWPEDIVSANWDSLVFDSGEKNLQRVPMLEPLRGTRQQTEDLIENSNSVSELLKRLEENIRDD
ncbi:MAG: depupylase/deamidase Dop [Actinomycetota bacterium]|jgi:proteasome accessory factor PafA2|nr:depupylase/deamidase Dop [Actinomycetota bacterium]